MYPRIIIALCLATVVARIAAAAVDDAAPGINRNEMRVLVTYYHWSRDAAVPSYTRSQLAQLFRASADSTTPGFGSDAQASRLAVALASAGVETFANALARQPEAIRHAVACYLTDLWFPYGLHYPKTKELLRPHT